MKALFVDFNLVNFLKRVLNDIQVCRQSRDNFFAKLTNVLVLAQRQKYQQNFFFSVLGGLLAAHLLIVDPQETFGKLYPEDEYDNDLLTLAHELGNRLLPAFESTNTGIPWPRVGIFTICSTYWLFQTGSPSSPLFFLVGHCFTG